MASANQMPGGYKFTPLVASQHVRANQHEPACFGLSSSWFFPSRSGIPLQAVVQPWFSLQRSISPWNVPPLVLPFCAIPPRPELQSSTGRRWCRKLWDRPGDTRQPTLFPGPPHSPRPPPFLLTSRTSAVSYPPCVPQIPQTRSASCVKSPRCSHFPSWEACPDSKSGRRDCAFANRCSEWRTCGGLGAAYRRGTRAGSTWRSRTALSRVPRLLASGLWARGERSVDRTARGCTSGSCTMRCVRAGRPRWTCRHFSSGCTPGPLPLRRMCRWTPASPSRVNTWSQSWPPIRWGQTPRIRPRSPPSSSSTARVIVRRPRHRQRKAYPKAASCVWMVVTTNYVIAYLD